MEKQLLEKVCRCVESSDSTRAWQSFYCLFPELSYWLNCQSFVAAPGVSIKTKSWTRAEVS